MRAAIKHALCSCLFISILILLLLLSSLIVRPKTNAREDGARDSSANGILSEPQHTIDALILGDSEAYCAFIPMKIWQDYGITSYVCATPAQKLCYSLEFLYKTFRNQSPKVVVLETNALYRKFGVSDKYYHKAEEWFSVFRYHNRWKSLQLKDWSFAVNYTFVQSGKGYLYNTAVNAAKTNGYMKASDEKQPVPPMNIKYLKEIQSFCTEHGAKLILVSTPSTKNWNYKRHNSVAALADELGISYLDMNLLQEEIPITWTKDTRDKGDHLNHFGALKVSSYFGKYLWEQKLFEDKRKESAYEHWNRATHDFNQSTANMTQPV